MIKMIFISVKNLIPNPVNLEMSNNDAINFIIPIFGSEMAGLTAFKSLGKGVSMTRVIVRVNGTE